MFNNTDHLNSVNATMLSLSVVNTFSIVGLIALAGPKKKKWYMHILFLD